MQDTLFELKQLTDEQLWEMYNQLEDALYYTHSLDSYERISSKLAAVHEEMKLRTSRK